MKQVLRREFNGEIENGGFIKVTEFYTNHTKRTFTRKVREFGMSKVVRILGHDVRV